jgi:hypothetical protein
MKALTGRQGPRRPVVAIVAAALAVGFTGVAAAWAADEPPAPTSTTRAPTTVTRTTTGYGSGLENHCPHTTLPPPCERYNTTTTARSSTTVPAPPVSPLCRFRPQIPTWLWRLLVQVFHLTCGPTPAPTTTTSTIRTTTTARPTTTTIVIGDVFGIEGVLGLVTCEGTPASPGECGPPVPTAGGVQVGDRIAFTDGAGHYLVSGIFTAVAVQGAVLPPPGRVLECPSTVVEPSPGGPARRFDPICRSFPAP